jgi:uncharacterized SAM-binding protein YcdF (DUF218 family)
VIKTRIQTHRALDLWNRLQRLSRVAANAAKNVVGHSEIRIERQRYVDLGLRPIQVPTECCGHRRDNSRERLVRVLFDRLFSVSFGQPQRAIRIIAPPVLAVALDEAAERITATAELARRYPDARIIFSGGSGSLLERDGPEAPFAVRELLALGVAHDRITAEEQSRNTIENAAYSRLLANPKPGERWLLVTSAYHMPRAMAAFRAVEAYPVDWRTRGWVDLQRGFPTLSEGLRRTDAATREWVGLIVYRLTGLSAQLLPGP